MRQGDAMTEAPLQTVGGLEWKFHRPETGLRVQDGAVIEGYASLFEARDQGGDAVAKGAYAASLAAAAAQGRRIAMLWQHDPSQPIGIWEDVREDARGLRVRGRILSDVARGREALALIGAGALDGLSIGYRVVRAERLPEGGRRLMQVDLWEVSLVTFPMLGQARVEAAKAGRIDAPSSDDAAILTGLAEAVRAARARFAR